MLRRFLVTLLQRSFLVLLLICLGCSAQSTAPDTAKAIERQVRSYYKLPPDVQVTIGPIHPSEFNNYDAVKLTFTKGTRKDEYDFLLSKDNKTLVKMTKLDLTKDPNAEIMKKMDVTNRPTRGNKQAKVVVVNYDDFQCPFCSRMHQTLFPADLQGVRRQGPVYLQGLPAGGDSSLGHSRCRKCQLPGRAEQRRLLGFRRLSACQPADGQRTAGPRRAECLSGPSRRVAGCTTQRGFGKACRLHQGAER